MEVTVNNIKLTIFGGAKVKDAIRAYYANNGEQIPDKMPVVRDAFGHKVGYEGTVLPDSVLYVEHQSGVFRRGLNLLSNLLKYIKL